MELGNFNRNINFTYGFGEEQINFLDLNVTLSNGKIQTALYVKLTVQPWVPSFSIKSFQTCQKVKH